MERHACRITLLCAILSAALAACGGGGTSTTVDSSYTFVWTGTVTGIDDAQGAEATIPGVNVGDTMTATMLYDPAEFAAGTGMPADMSYDAPDGLLMTFVFSSGGTLTRTVRSVRAYDTGGGVVTGVDVLQFVGTADLVFLTEGPGSILPVPLPADFAEMNALVVAGYSSFTFIEHEVFFGNEDRWIYFTDMDVSITKN